MLTVFLHSEIDADEFGSDDARSFYFFFPESKVGCHAVPFRLAAAAITLIFSFLGFLASRLPLCWPLAMSNSLGFGDCANRR